MPMPKEGFCSARLVDTLDRAATSRAKPVKSNVTVPDSIWKIQNVVNKAEQFLS
jgi:hypothetical protein